MDIRSHKIWEYEWEAVSSQYMHLLLLMQHHRRVQDQAAVATAQHGQIHAVWRGDETCISITIFHRHSAPQQNAGLPPLHRIVNLIRVEDRESHPTTKTQHTGPRVTTAPPYLTGELSPSFNVLGSASHSLWGWGKNAVQNLEELDRCLLRHLHNIKC